MLLLKSVLALLALTAGLVVAMVTMHVDSTAEVHRQHSVDQQALADRFGGRR